MSADRSGTPSMDSKWLEAKTSDGRKYWSHSVTKQSVWDKPDELRTPFERAMGKTAWKQYDAKGRPYYVNSQTKETKWDLPPELEELRRKVDDEEQAKERTSREDKTRLAIEDGPLGSDPGTSLSLRDANPFESNSDFIKLEAGPSRSPSPSPEPEEAPIRIPPGGFRTFEAAEDAFISLLRRNKVDEGWSWDVTMRKIITDPLYKALNTLAEKKNAWAKYQANLVATRDARRKERMDKARPGISKLLAAYPRIRGYSTFKTAEEIFANERHWMALADAGERETLFAEYVKGLQVAEENSRIALRTRDLALTRDLVKELPITVFTRWREARDLIRESDQFRTDPSLKSMDDSDLIDTFSELALRLVREHDEQFRKTSIVRQRKGRKARDAYRALLHDMEAKGQITSLSKWTETRELIESTPEYEALLGLPGSSPLELWQDLVDDLQEAVEAGVDKVERALKAAGQESRMTLDMPYEDYQEILRETHLAAQIDDKLHRQVFDAIQSELRKIADDQKKRAERKRRHAIEDLRYALKKVDPPIDLDSSFDDAVPAMEKLREYQDISDEDARREAFDKYVKRQKEKAEAQVDKKKRRAEAADFDMEAAPDGRSRDRDGSREPAGHRSDRHRERQRSPSPRTSDAGRGDRDRHRERERDRERRSDRDRERSHRDSDRHGDERDDRDRDRDRDREDRKRKDKDRSERESKAEANGIKDEDEPVAKRIKTSAPVVLASDDPADEEEDGEI